MRRNTEAGKVDAPITAKTLSLQQRMLDNGATNALDLQAKASTQTWNTRFIAFGGCRDFSGSLGKEFEHATHPPGAISRNRANTWPAGIGWDSPASKRAMRRALSASQAASAPGSGSKSTLSSRRRARIRRCSGGRT